jgi:hypothetical protein
MIVIDTKVLIQSQSIAENTDAALAHLQNRI